MRLLSVTLLAVGVFCLAAFSIAQPPTGGKDFKKGGPPADPEAAVKRLMAFDKNGDGKLTKEELNDARLNALFDRADANKDGFVTREELTALMTKEAAALQSSGKGGPFDGKGDKGGKGGPPPFEKKK